MDPSTLWMIFCFAVWIVTFCPSHCWRVWFNCPCAARSSLFPTVRTHYNCMTPVPKANVFRSECLLNVTCQSSHISKYVISQVNNATCGKSCFAVEGRLQRMIWHGTWECTHAFLWPGLISMTVNKQVEGLSEQVHRRLFFHAQTDTKPLPSSLHSAAWQFILWRVK